MHPAANDVTPQKSGNRDKLRTVTLFNAGLLFLAVVCHVAFGSSANDDPTTMHGITVNANGDETASLPDFDGDGTIGLGDFVKFAAKFGLSQDDVGYDAQFDLNDDAEVGFSGRRLGTGSRLYSVPSSSASLLLLSRAIRASRPSLTRAVFCLIPVELDALFSRASSILSVVCICYNMYKLCI